MQAKDYPGAIKLLEVITARDPQNPRPWRNLGLAHQLNKEYDAAIAAYTTAYGLDPKHPLPIYNLGTVYALKGDADHAFEWLAKAKASLRVDMSQAETDADLASLKSDPRFKAMLPSPEDFANPFVEPVKILHEWDGEATNDQFGWIARNLGDVDGDHVPDIVTSAPTWGASGANAGRIYVYSTKTGKLLWSADGKRRRSARVRASRPRATRITTACRT